MINVISTVAAIAQPIIGRANQAEPPPFGGRLLISLAALLLVLAPTLATSQSTITITAPVLRAAPKRIGLNISSNTFFGAGQLLKNFAVRGAGFEPQHYQTVFNVAVGGTTTATDNNVFEGYPTGFWDGAPVTIQGGAGSNGTVAHFVAADSSGCGNPVTSTCHGGIWTFTTALNMSTSDPVHSKPTQFAVAIDKLCCATPGGINGSVNGWFGGDSTKAVGVLDTTKPGTGQHVLEVTGTTSIEALFDSTANTSAVRMNGPYKFTVLVKAVSGSPTMTATLTRDGTGAVLLPATNVPVTSGWTTQTLTFTPAEAASLALGTARLHLAFTVPAGAVLHIDDVYLGENSTTRLSDGTSLAVPNTTIFRNDVVRYLLGQQPGSIRYMNSALGCDVGTMIGAENEIKPCNFNPYFPYIAEDTQFTIGAFLDLAKLIGADAHITTGGGGTAAEYTALINYAKAHQAYPAISTVYFEFANEMWNPAFGPENVLNEFQAALWNRQYTAARAASGWDPAKMKLVANGQYYAPDVSSYILDQAPTTNATTWSVGSYAPQTLNYSSASAGFADVYMKYVVDAIQMNNTTGTANQGNFFRLHQLVGSSRGLDFNAYEGNQLGAGLSGSMTQTQLNGTYSEGQAIAEAGKWLLAIRDNGMLEYNLFNMVDPGTWGTVPTDILSTTSRVRPLSLAMKLVNQAIGSGSNMITTAKSGTDFTFTASSDDLVGSTPITCTNCSYIQPFAWASGTNRSLIVFNYDPAVAHAYRIVDAAATGNSVTLQQLNQAVDATNEAGVTVAVQTPAATTIGSTISLPAHSMTLATYSTTVTPPTPPVQPPVTVPTGGFKKCTPVSIGTTLVITCTV